METELFKQIPNEPNRLVALVVEKLKILVLRWTAARWETT